MHLHLFGASTPSGEAFRRLAASTVPGWTLHAYSRRPSHPDGVARADANKPADLTDPASLELAGALGEPALWISFAPIWLLAPCLEQLALAHPDRLEGLRGLVACSSSSVLTKRYAANALDRQLVASLMGAEEQLLATCRRLRLPCRILQPTLIYGKEGAYGDRNLSRWLQLMRRFPLLPLPAHTGLRQPIHASQLASVALQLACQFADARWEPQQGERLPVGGDQELTYRAMLEALRQALPPGDPARHCLLLRIPDRVFLVLAAPLLLLSPKAFEAVLRIGADLAGFTPTHRLLGTSAQRFPVLPLT